MRVGLPLPAEGDHPSLLQLRGAHLPHEVGHHSQLGQGKAIQETGHVAQHFVGKRGQRVVRSSRSTASLPPSKAGGGIRAPGCLGSVTQANRGGGNQAEAA